MVNPPPGWKPKHGSPLGWRRIRTWCVLWYLWRYVSLPPLYHCNDSNCSFHSELGLLVWQDFQFACGVYPAHEDFVASVKQEAIDNVTRLRHHASIVCFCGNNEDYQMVLQWGGKFSMCPVFYVCLFWTLDRCRWASGTFVIRARFPRCHWLPDGSSYSLPPRFSIWRERMGH